jgi:hypothetical protein
MTMMERQQIKREQKREEFSTAIREYVAAEFRLQKAQDDFEKVMVSAN